MESDFFSVHNLCFSYYHKSLCLRDISFDIKENEKIMILASSEMGKTTFLSVVSSFEPDYFGQILYKGRELKTIPDEQKKFSFLPTKPVLFENKTIRSNLLFLKTTLNENNLKLQNEENCKHFKIKSNLNDIFLDENLTKLLEEFKIQNSLDTKVKKLSTVKKQELAILRSYIKSPSIIFLDDQFQALNNSDLKEMEEIYKKIIEDKSKTVFFAIDNNTFIKSIEFLKTLKIDKIIYLVNSQIKIYNSIFQFINNIENLDQLNFYDQFNFFEGTIINENSRFYLELKNDISFILNNKTIEKFINFNLENGDIEYITLALIKSMKPSDLNEFNFNNLIEKNFLFLFSSLGGERLV